MLETKQRHKEGDGVEQRFWQGDAFCANLNISPDCDYNVDLSWPILLNGFHLLTERETEKENHLDVMC